jgi:hypothetical protein
MRRLLLAPRGNKFALPSGRRLCSLGLRDLLLIISAPAHGRLRGAVLPRRLIPRFEPVALFMSSPGVTAMVQNLVVGLVVVALIIIGVLAYAQKHEGCLHGRSLQTFKPCGSVSVDL